MSDSQCQLGGKRKEPSQDGIVDPEQRMAKRPTVEGPSRPLWIWVESLNARIEVLERHKDDQPRVKSSSSPPKDNPSLKDNSPPRDNRPHSSSPINSEAHSLLVEALIAASNRLSVMEAKMDISYRGAFINTIEKGKCIVRGCNSKAVRSDHVLRHVRDTKNPEHEVAAIVLDQTKCFQCNKSLHSLSSLKHHECTVHKEQYESRIDIFKPVLEQHSGTAYIVRNPSGLQEWMLLGPMGYKDICGSNQASTVGSDSDILQPPSNAFESNGLSQSNRSPPQTVEQSATSAQPEPDDTSLPRNHLEIQESQYEPCPRPTDQNFFEVPYNGLESNGISQSNMLTLQTVDESASLVQPSAPHCASLRQGHPDNPGGQYAPLATTDLTPIFPFFDTSLVHHWPTAAYFAPNAEVQSTPQFQQYHGTT